MDRPDAGPTDDATAGPDVDPAVLAELQHDGHTRAELRKARREFLLEAAMEAERDTGRREKTDEEAKHSLWMRIARLVGGWILVLLGLAAIPLPGPGWLMVLLGLTLLPYRWTDNLIREIRRRIPGIPEDGRIPTRTWIVTGVIVAAATGGSLWWGLRDQGEDTVADRDTGAAAGEARTDNPPVEFASFTDDTDRRQITTIYAHVIAEVGGAGAAAANVDGLESADPCGDLTSGRVDLIVPTLTEAGECFGGTTAEEIRTAADSAGAKVFAPVTVGDLVYVPVARHDRVAIDDEPAELAIDGVTGVINGGATVSGDGADRARALMREAGVLK